MDENEFRRLLDLFPVVRSRDFVFESESSRQSTSKSSHNELKEWHDAWDHGDNKQVAIEGLYQHDAFWTKLKTAAERKVGAAEAERFCEAFQRIHKKLVYEELSSGAAQNILKLSINSDK
ncbi:uncharacterized protein LOC21396723 [Morus notabilis]|uniref:uncharacterized protein LOC21396723 n=1 Tax=Morus notabilis TaxID=981085 RepID=UPI000CED47D9|nr:uncharacterized protein LOC21396723 [Morus notabilis]